MTAPPDGQRRPLVTDGALNPGEKFKSTVGQPAASWRALAACPAESLFWASLGYRAGYEDGRRDLRAEIAHAGQIVASATADFLASTPRHDVIAARRAEAPTTGCGLRSCRGRCARCIAAEAHAARGGRRYLGVEVERLIAQTSPTGVAQ